MAYSPATVTYTPAPPRRRKRPRAVDHPNHERWLVSYADFITLLFAFFTTLYAISTVDAKKLTAMVGSMQEAFEPGATDGAGRDFTGRTPVPASSRTLGQGGEVALADIRRQVTDTLAASIAAKRVEIELDRRGLVISIREAGSFPLGSADLSAEARALLGELGGVLTGIGNRVQVEGHTDDVPIHTARFASNWELSTARATNVIAYLLEHATVEPKRLSAAGYGEYHPRVPNESDSSRARNRRIDIVILKPDAADAANPQG